MYTVIKKEEEKVKAMYAFIFFSKRNTAGPASTIIIININGITAAKRYPKTLHPFPTVISIDFFKESTIPSLNMTAM